MAWTGETSNNQTKKKLDLILESVRSATRNKYLQMFLMTSAPNGATMNEIALKLKGKPQTIHPMLKRALEREGLIREKRGSEFRYHLHPSISKEDVELRIKSIDGENSTDTTPLLDLEDDEKPEQSQFGENQPKKSQVQVINMKSNLDEPDRGSVSRSILKESSLAEILIKKLPKLPDFNPNWDKEQQDRWFVLYEKMVNLQTKKDD